MKSKLRGPQQRVLHDWLAHEADVVWGELVEYGKGLWDEVGEGLHVPVGGNFLDEGLGFVCVKGLKGDGDLERAPAVAISGIAPRK